MNNPSIPPTGDTNRRIRHERWCHAEYGTDPCECVVAPALAEVDRLRSEIDSLTALVGDGTMPFVRSQVALKADNDRLRDAIRRHRDAAEDFCADCSQNFLHTANDALWSHLEDGGA